MGLFDLSRELKTDPRIHNWLEELGGITDEPPGITRTFLSPALERAKQSVAGWMRNSGLEIFEDEAGNLIGRLDCGNPSAGTVACGSHLDSVRNAGRFDGPMGIVAGILAAERVAALKTKRSFHLEIVAFSDEEGVRFQTTYLGSRYYIGQLGEAEKAFADDNGVTVQSAIAAHIPKFSAPPPRRLIGYVEAHIEQGPVLENERLALGVVTAIAGQTRARVTITGKAGHAGTTPMNMRYDALTGAAECVLLIETLARHTEGMVATVGQLTLRGAASNVIPGQVQFTIDARHADDSVRRHFCREIFTKIEACAEVRHLKVDIEIPLEAPAAQCSPRLCERLEQSVTRFQPRVPRLVSGAGHDAVMLASVTEATMLFVRCRDGLSHHPDEYASAEDIALAVDVLADFISEFPSHA